MEVNTHSLTGGVQTAGPSPRPGRGAPWPAPNQGLDVHTGLPCVTPCAQGRVRVWMAVAWRLDAVALLLSWFSAGARQKGA